MKKLFSLFLIGFTVYLFGQTVDEAKKFSELVDLTIKNKNDINKLDSIKKETKSLYDNSKSILLRNSIRDFIGVLNDLSDNNYTAKPLIKEISAFSNDDLKKFVVNNDKFKESIFINPKKAYNRGYWIFPYISINEKTVRLRLKTKYDGKEWLFFNTVVFNIDGINYSYIVEPSRETYLGGVTEISDTSVNAEMLDILNKILNSNSQVEYRLTGDKYIDRKLSDVEKEAIQDILNLYKNLTE